MSFEKEILKGKKIGVCSCDAGGANYIKAYVDWNKIKCQYLLDGPAVKIFNVSKIENNIDEFVEKNDLIITGTSWSNNLEKEVIKKSLKSNKPVLTIIDHWANYLDRFILEDQLILPNYMFFYGQEAFQLGNEIFKDYPEVKLYQTPNYYLNQFKRNRKKNIQTDAILFIDEPIEEHYGTLASEKAILIELIQKQDIAIHIRLHPHSKEGKYGEITDKYPKIKELPKGSDLIDELCNYNTIVGIDSMALMVAYELGLKVYTLPLANIPRTLPIQFKDYYNE